MSSSAVLDEVASVPISLQTLKPATDRANPRMGIGMLAFSPDSYFLATRNGECPSCWDCAAHSLGPWARGTAGCGWPREVLQRSSPSPGLPWSSLPPFCPTSSSSSGGSRPGHRAPRHGAFLSNPFHSGGSARPTCCVHPGWLSGWADQGQWSSGDRALFPHSPLDNVPNAVWVWDIQKLSLFVVLEQLSPVRSFQWDPQQPRLAICTGASKVYLWSPAGCMSVQVPGEGKHSRHGALRPQRLGAPRPPASQHGHSPGPQALWIGSWGLPSQGTSALCSNPPATSPGDFPVLSLCWHSSGDSLALLGKDHFCLCFLETSEGVREALGQRASQT